MYIPEFWCGVIATALCEIVFCIGISIIGSLRGGGKDETTEKTD